MSTHFGEVKSPLFPADAVASVLQAGVAPAVFRVCCVCWKRRSPRCQGPLNSSLVGRMCGIDPSAGSPTETLLRLLLPLNDKVQASFEESSAANRAASLVPRLHRTIQSVGATGGVYKGQGRNQRELMTRAY